MEHHLPGGPAVGDHGAGRGTGADAELLRLVFDAAPIPKAVVGLNGLWLEVNQALCDLLGYPDGVLRGLRYQDVTHPDDLAACLELVDRVASGELPGFSIEKRYICASGQPVWVQAHIQALRNENGVVDRYVAQIIDIDERHRLQEAAEAAERRLTEANAAMSTSLAAAQVSRARYEALVDHMPDTAVYVYDAQGRIVMAEGSAVADRGFNPRELLGRRAEDVLSADDAEIMTGILTRAAAGEGTSLVVRLTTTGLDNLVDAIPVARPDGQSETLVLARDISALKRGQVRLQRAESRLRALFDQAPSAILETTLDGFVTGGNQTLVEMIGYSLDELESRPWWEFVHPDDVPQLRARVEARVHGRRVETPVEYRVLRSDGSIPWVSSRASLVTLEGEAPTLVIHLTDVTDQREQRQMVERANARFAALVQNGSDVISVMDDDLTVTYLSPSYSDMFGRRIDSVLGTPAIERVHPDDRDAFLRHLTRLKATPCGVERFDARIPHGVGGWRWVEVTASNQLDHPAVAGIVCNVRDITERVELTDKLAYQAMHDPLTGLANRVLLDDRISVAIGQAERAEAPVAILYLDLDGFKDVNDHYGHAAGDALLVEIAERLKGSTRPGDTVARLGGDEFVVVSGDFSESGAIELAERLRAAVQEPIAVGESQVTVRCSIGIGLGVGGTPAELLHQADAALYEAKRAGRNAWKLAAVDSDRSHLRTVS